MTFAKQLNKGLSRYAFYKLRVLIIFVRNVRHFPRTKLELATGDSLPIQVQELSFHSLTSGTLLEVLKHNNVCSVFY